MAAATTSKHEVFASLKAAVNASGSRRISPANESVAPTGFAALDGILGGGFSRGAIGTLEGAASSGRAAVAAATLAVATSRSLAAVVDDGSLYPPTLAAAGVRLDRVLVVPAKEPAGIARAIDILLRSRAFSAVVAPSAPLKSTIWSRLAGLAQKADTLVLVHGAPAPSELAYFASVRVACTIERVLWCNDSGPFCELLGYDVRAHVLKHRRAAPGKTACLRVVRTMGHAPLRERTIGRRHLSVVAR